MTNEDLAKLIERTREHWQQRRELLIEVAEDLLKRRTDSQPKPVEESTFERDENKQCRKYALGGGCYCTRTNGHAGEHHAHGVPGGVFITSWPNESPAPPKRDYGRERAEKINIDVETPFRSPAVWVAALRDDIAAALNSARADGFEEAVKSMQWRGLHIPAEDVRKLK